MTARIDPPEPTGIAPSDGYGGRGAASESLVVNGSGLAAGSDGSSAPADAPLGSPAPLPSSPAQAGIAPAVPASSDEEQLVGASDPFRPVLEAATALWQALGEFQDPEDTAEALRSLRAVVAGLRMIDDDLADRLADVVSYGDTSFGDRRVTKRRGSIRKAWDHDAIIPRLVAQALDERRIDRETGEVLETEASAVVRVLKEGAGISYWRTGVLKKRGLDPDEYCSTEAGRTRIEVS